MIQLKKVMMIYHFKKQYYKLINKKENMYDPYSVIKDFKLGRIAITLWHKDPCSDGSDDSCGKTIRSRHLNPQILEKIKHEFEFNLKQNYWFYPNSFSVFSPGATLQLMYKCALLIIYNGNKKKINSFFKNHIHEIYILAENPHDCLGDIITNKWNYKTKELYSERIGLAATIYADIISKDRKWYQKPEWHINHWKLSIKFMKNYKQSNELKTNK